MRRLYRQTTAIEKAAARLLAKLGSHAAALAALRPGISRAHDRHLRHGEPAGERYSFWLEVENEGGVGSGGAAVSTYHLRRDEALRSRDTWVELAREVNDPDFRSNAVQVAGRQNCLALRWGRIDREETAKRAARRKWVSP